MYPFTVLSDVRDNVRAFKFHKDKTDIFQHKSRTAIRTEDGLFEARTSFARSVECGEPERFAPSSAQMRAGYDGENIGLPEDELESDMAPGRPSEARGTLNGDRHHQQEKIPVHSLRASCIAIARPSPLRRLPSP